MDKNSSKILLLETKGDLGGVPVFLLNLARELKSRGYDVTVAFGEGDYLPAALDLEHIPYHRLRWLKRSHNPFSHLLFIFEFKRFLKKNHFSTVHINSSNALVAVLACRLSPLRPKTIFTVHGLSLLDDNYLLDSWFKSGYHWYFRILFKRVDEIVFVCNHNRDALVNQGFVKTGKVIYNGLDANRLLIMAQHEAQAALAAAANPRLRVNWLDSFVIGTVSRLDYQKNQDFLINIFPDILRIKSNTVLIVIGEGEKRGEYEELIKKNKLEKHVFLAGAIPDSARFLKAFDMFVLPSRYEGLPITLIEAAIAGLPVLATNVGGNPEVLNNSAAQLYALDNKEEFLEKFRILVENKMERMYLGEQNKQFSKNFSLKKSVDAYLELYK